MNYALVKKAFSFKGVFVNRATKHELKRAQENIDREQELQMLEKFTAYRKTLPKSKRPSEEVLAEMRTERSGLPF